MRSLGDEWALADMDLKIGQGEKVVIAGPAGSGKDNSAAAPGCTHPAHQRGHPL
ncbi:MAG: hypothetical protein MZV70_37140 [Desulfobacterales bacterium]|nr:hypothetical protein [Desulfobacterales bacterium]